MNIQDKMLIYDPNYTGHHSEFINNILTYIEQYPLLNKKIFFAIHPRIIEMLNLKNRIIPNVEYIILPKKEKISILARYFYQLSEVKTIAKKKDIKHVLLLYLNSFFISLAFGQYDFLVYGIIFDPFNPNCEQYSFLKRLSKEFYYCIVSKRQMVKKLFVLNDKKSCEYLNRHFCTDKFHYLPDPIPYYEKEELPKEIVEIKHTRKIALHFGAMDGRKGTLLILDAIAMLPADVIQEISFFFVGKPNTETFGMLLKNKIDQLQSQISNIHIHYNPHFVSAGQMESYYELSDFVLMPYLSNNMSSGVLGHAAKHNKSVITGRGLLGEIVEEYGLGVSINTNVENLNSSIQNLTLNKTHTNGIKYVEEHSVDIFVEILLNCLK